MLCKIHAHILNNDADPHLTTQTDMQDTVTSQTRRLVDRHRNKVLKGSPRVAAMTHLPLASRKILDAMVADDGTMPLMESRRSPTSRRAFAASPEGTMPMTRTPSCISGLLFMITPRGSPGASLKMTKLCVWDPPQSKSGETFEDRIALQSGAQRVEGQVLEKKSAWPGGLGRLLSRGKIFRPAALHFLIHVIYIYNCRLRARKIRETRSLREHECP